jgi:hypothetical protein
MKECAQPSSESTRVALNGVLHSSFRAHFPRPTAACAFGRAKRRLLKKDRIASISFIDNGRMMDVGLAVDSERGTVWREMSSLEGQSWSKKRSVGGQLCID